MDRVTLTSPQVAALRLRALGLVRTPDDEPAAPAEVVRRLLAAQAQDFTASRWAIGGRAGVDEPAVFDAYDRGEIVRSWPMRGTVHVTAAEDLHWLLALTGVRALNPTSLARRWALLGIDETFLERAREQAIALLRGGGRATRAELAQVLTEAGMDVSSQRMYHVVWYLAQTGTLVQGPTRGGEHQLVLLDEWVAEPRRLDRDAALRELVVRYLRSHGPATLDDLAWWSGLTKSDLRAGIAMAGDEVAPAAHSDDGRELLIVADLLDTHDPDPAPLRRATFALAAFDEHLLGYARRDDVVDMAHARAIDPMRNGVFRATIVHGGRVIAIWRTARRAGGVWVSLTPLAGLTETQRRGATRALARWSDFRGEHLVDVQVVAP